MSILRSLAVLSAPCASNTRTLSGSPESTAKCRGVEPKSFWTFTSAPCRSSHSTECLVPYYIQYRAWYRRAVKLCQVVSLASTSTIDRSTNSILAIPSEERDSPVFCTNSRISKIARTLSRSSPNNNEKLFVGSTIVIGNTGGHRHIR